MRRHAEATTRNREPILEVLVRYVREGAHVLEVASGTGEHAVYFAEHLPVARWQPSDPDAGARASIDAWREASGSARVLPSLALDVTEPTWPVTRADVIVAINMIHISPWSACLGLLEGARRLLAPDGILFLYGPYRRGGAATSPSNEAFDLSLRARNPAWGVRDLESVVAEADVRGLAHAETAAMPANNLSVVFRRRGGA